MSIVWFFCALFGGIATCCSSIINKADVVVQKNPHPLLFQSFYTFWYLVSAALLVLGRLILSRPGVDMSWWAMVSGGAWVPASVALILAVPRIGIIMTMSTVAATVCIVSFLIIWFVMGIRVETGTTDGRVLEPLYLFFIFLGSGYMVLSQAVCHPMPIPQGSYIGPLDIPPPSSYQAQTSDIWVVDPSSFGVTVPSSSSRWTQQEYSGLSLALTAGFTLSINLLVLILSSQVSGGCQLTPGPCPVNLEAFDDVSSWLVSSAVGAGMVTLVWIGLLYVRRLTQQRPLGNLHFRSLAMLGSLGGVGWSLACASVSMAMSKGHPILVIPAYSAALLVSAGLWGILRHNEIHGGRGLCWFLGCCWTVVFLMLLCDGSPG